MADRDVEIDVNLRDKTGPGVKSTEQGLRKVSREADRQRGALGKVADQWGRGLSKIGGKAAAWAGSGAAAGKKFVRGVGAGISKLAELGGAIGSGLSKAVDVAGPYLKVALVAVLGAAAVAAAPAIAGALVGGAGLGGMVGGILIASKDARVSAAFTALKEEAGTSLQDAAKRFIPATLNAVKIARTAFRGMLPDLKQIFDVSSTWVAPLTRSLAGGAQSALDGITRAVSKAGPIIAVIGKGIEGIGKATGEVFAGLADNGNSMALALKGVFWLVEGSIRSVGLVLNALVEAFEFFVNKIPGGKRLLDSMSDSQDRAKGESLDLAGGFRALATDSNMAADGITRAREAAEAMTEGALSLREAQIAARDAVKQSTETIKENGRAKGFNSAKARENESALNAAARAFNAEAVAGEKSGQSANAASNAYQRNRAAMVSMAQKAGYSKAEAEKLAAQLLRIPRNVKTDINVNTAAATTRLDTFQKKINGLRGKTVTVQVKTSGDHYIPGVGTQLKNAAIESWGPAAGGGTSRTGGPTPVRVDSTVNVSLDGTPFYAYTARAVSASEKRTAWRQKVGRR
ncbi:hypothetical protein ACLQ25_09490 [Micromonospora sp. DT44]|uniref:hypothetical protein n=1 Tax=Micromonospora sp. DT44 TaxID=3393439 RepID=UPI003CF8FDC2